MLVDVVGQVYHQDQRCTAADWTVSLTRNIHPCVTLASQVQVLALELFEDIEELLEEPDDLRCDIILVLQRMESVCTLSFKSRMSADAYRNVRLSLGEARADGLLEEEDAGQVRPAELVLRRVCLAIRPLERLQTSTATRK